MFSKIDKNAVRQKRHLRLRQKVSGTATVPRLNVYRSLNHIYAQVIDDVQQVTLCAASTVEKDLAAQCADLSKTEQAKVIGKAIAERALNLSINAVVFDRGGYVYTGRVAALADAAREAGLKF